VRGKGVDSLETGFFDIKGETIVKRFFMDISTLKVIQKDTPL